MTATSNDILKDTIGQVQLQELCMLGPMLGERAVDLGGVEDKAPLGHGE